MKPLKIKYSNILHRLSLSYSPPSSTRNVDGDRVTYGYMVWPPLEWFSNKMTWLQSDIKEPNASLGQQGCELCETLSVRYTRETSTDGEGNEPPLEK